MPFVMVTDLAARFWPRVCIRGPDECWEWQAGKSQGYGSIYVHGKGRMAAPRVAFYLAHGRWQYPGLYILHSCDNRLCVNPAHLHEGTHLDNVREAKERGRMWAHKGEASARAKLTESQVLEMRRLHAEYWAVSILAERFGLCIDAVRQIIAGKRWAHLPVMRARCSHCSGATRVMPHGSAGQPSFCSRYDCQRAGQRWYYHRRCQQAQEAQ